MWMWTVAGILAVAGLMAAIEIPALRRNKKDLWVFSLLLLVGTGLGLTQGLHVKLPNPLDWMAVVFKPFSNWIKNALG